MVCLGNVTIKGLALTFRLNFTMACWFSNWADVVVTLVPSTSVTVTFATA